LYFFTEKIINMNLSYVTVGGQVASAAAVEKFLAEEFSPLTESLGKLKVFVVEQTKAPSADQKKSENKRRASDD
jgi:hypothetical protein